MKNELIISEFCKSTLKAFAEHAKKMKCQDTEVQISLQLNNGGKDNIYTVRKNFAPVATVGLNDIMFVNSLYSFIKPKVAKVINNSLHKLEQLADPGEKVSVFLMKSVVPGKVRMMLYVGGEYKRDLLAEEVINLN